MQIDRRSLEGLLSLNDRQLMTIINRLVATSGIDPAQFNIDPKDVASIRTAISSASDEELVALCRYGMDDIAENRPQELLRRAAQRRGLIVLTDSDGAGFVIRNRIRGTIPETMIKHAYIPDVYGKEKRKRQPGKEGKLGVEGMPPKVLEQVLRRAGATFLEEDRQNTEKAGITKADLFAAGLTGGADSGARRRQLLKKLELPEHMSTNALLAVLNGCYSAEEVRGILKLEEL